MSEAAIPGADATAETAEVSSDQLPEWAREKMSKANAEAAKYRTERNELAEQLDVATAFQTQFTEESAAHAETRAALEAKDRELLKLKAVLELDVPAKKASEVAALIQGTNQDEINEHAQKVVALLGANNTRTPAVDPSPAGASASLALNDDDGLTAMIADHLGL